MEQSDKITRKVSLCLEFYTLCTQGSYGVLGHTCTSKRVQATTTHEVFFGAT